MGVYSLKRSIFDVLLVAGMSGVGFLLMRLGFEAAPLLMGFILGPMIEENLRRSLLLSRGDAMIFLERPVSAVFLALTVLMLGWVLWGVMRPNRPVSGQPKHSDLKGRPTMMGMAIREILRAEAEVIDGLREAGGRSTF